MASPKPFHNVFVGAETGLLKGLNAEKKTWCNLNKVEAVSKENEINVMCWDDPLQTRVCLGRRKHTLEVYDTQKQQHVASHQLQAGKGIFRGLEKYDNGFLTCTESGLLQLWQENGEKKLEVNVGDNIWRMRQNPQQHHLVATGGKENDLKIWDLQNPTEPVFKAKNVKNDWLNLQVPVWVTDMAFLPDSRRIVTCTGHHQVRVYDPSCSQRRPVIDIKFDEYPLMALTPRPGYDQVVVGNTHGTMALIDLRGKGHMVHCYKGFAGAIRSIQSHPTRDVVASCGLDRFLRIHDIGSKQLLHKVYLKSRLNCVLLSDKWSDTDQDSTRLTEDCEVDDVDEGLGAEQSDDEEDEALKEEEMWAGMDVVGAKKRHHLDSGEDCSKDKESSVTSSRQQSLRSNSGGGATAKKSRSQATVRPATGRSKKKKKPLAT